MNLDAFSNYFLVFMVTLTTGIILGGVMTYYLVSPTVKKAKMILKDKERFV